MCLLRGRSPPKGLKLNHQLPRDIRVVSNSVPGDSRLWVSFTVFGSVLFGFHFIVIVFFCIAVNLYARVRHRVLVAALRSQ